MECQDGKDEHYEELQMMKRELESFRTKDNKPYNLIPLPMPSAKFDERGDRLPATYINFLITNEALVYPIYSVDEDKTVHKIFNNIFSTKEIIPVECSRLIIQGGSLHCSTMQIL
jgi:agmatine deiminase